LYKQPPSGVSTVHEFDHKVQIYEHEDLCANHPEPNCKYCDGKKTKPTYMTSKEYIHDDRVSGNNPKRGLQLKFNKYKNFQERCCKPRNDALHLMVKYVQSKAGYKDAKTNIRLYVSPDDALRKNFIFCGFDFQLKK
jgi:hypothetical protein